MTSTKASPSSSPVRHQNYALFCVLQGCFGAENKGAEGFRVNDFIFHTVEVIGSNPIAPTIFSMAYVLQILSVGPSRVQLLQNVALGLAFRRGHRLCVTVQGDTGVSVS